MDGTLVDSSLATILIVEDDPSIARMLGETMEAEGYAARIAGTGEQGIEIATREVPQLILLDLMLPGIDGFEVVRHLRSSAKTAHIPVMILSAHDETNWKVRAFNYQVDDYLTKPFNGDELLARIRTQLRHVQETLLSPLTGLPSGLRVERAIEQQLETAGAWALLYIDLDNFKAYNDVYGFLQGNEMIRLLARILTECLSTRGNAADFAGHIGGDDFVAITTPDKVDALCAAIVAQWDAQSLAFYSTEDLQRKILLAVDRQGYEQHFPLVAVSIGVVTNYFRPITSMAEVSRVAAEVKKKAKSLPGSTYYIDQRGAGHDLGRGLEAEAQPNDRCDLPTTRSPLDTAGPSISG